LVSAGGRIVYLGVDDSGALHLIALDPTTGEVAWDRASTAATHIGGVEQALVTDGDVVVHVEPPGGGGNSRVALPAQQKDTPAIVGVDARTGEPRWQHPIADVFTPLEKCGADACATTPTPDRHLDITRLSISRGLELSSGQAAFEPLLATDGGLQVSAARESDEVVLTKDFGQTIAWTHTRAELFGRDDLSPNRGWGGQHIDGVWVLWLGGDNDLGATSGVSDDGTVLWTRSGVAPCFNLVGSPMPAPIVCGELDQAAKKVRVGNVQRIDPRSGAPVWSLPTTGLDAFAPGSSVVRYDDTHFGFHLENDDAGLDLATGPAPLPSGQGWCQTTGQHVMVEGKRALVATSWAPCRIGVGPDAMPPSVVPSFAGPTVDHVGAWIEGEAVHGARVR
jgi:outer membrane protein assembly factor BamB